tara:strand:+ start:155 stop:628 length:474 start_codon:yes stop_codon:yes gene_type:complete
MTDPVTMTLIGAGISAGATVLAADGTKQVGRYNKQIADRNAKVAEQKAEMALFDASRNAVKFRNDFRALNDASALAMRKNNVAITGSALDVLLNNALNFEIDNENQRRQAAATASDYRENAVNERLRGQLALYEAKQQSRAMKIAAIGKFATTYGSV